MSISSASDHTDDTANDTAGAFTPGPYLLEGTTVYALDENGKVNRFSANVQGGYVRKVERTSKAELVATATLFSAAPDLYEALIAALPYIESELDNAAYKRGAVARAIRQMHAALAKARGEQ